MAAQDNGKIQHVQGGDILNFVTGAKITFNSTQIPGFEAASTAHTTNGNAALDALGGKINAIRDALVSIGVLAST